jgi:hypothetical protein
MSLIMKDKFLNYFYMAKRKSIIKLKFHMDTSPFIEQRKAIPHGERVAQHVGSYFFRTSSPKMKMTLTTYLPPYGSNPVPGVSSYSEKYARPFARTKSKSVIKEQAARGTCSHHKMRSFNVTGWNGVVHI